MGTEIAEAPGTASLTLALNGEAARLIARTTTEIDLSPDQFAMVERVASSPPPVLHRAEQKEFKAMIGSMAVTLKAPKRSLDEGKFQLAVYWRILGHLPLVTLQHVAERAVRTCIFMPTPAELLKMAEDFTAPELLLHERARVLARHRRQRLFEETLARIKDGLITQEEVDALPEHVKRTAEAAGTLRRLETGEWTQRPRFASGGPKEAEIDGIGDHIERSLKIGEEDQ